MPGLPLAFSVPLVLATLAVLPALWYLLRITPPRPRQIAFPPLRLILDLKPKEETPARTPWWLLLMRLALAAFIIIAMAGPIWNPLPPGEGGKGPLLVVLDDGWASAPNWAQQTGAASDLIAAAARDGRPSAIAAVSDAGRDIALGDEDQASERLRALKPSPFIPDRMLLLPAVQRFTAAHHDADIVWITDGLAAGNARSFAEGLVAAANGQSVRVLKQDHVPLAVGAVTNTSGTLDVHVLRADTSGAAVGTLRALDLKGLSVGEAPFNFGLAKDTKASFDLPIELRNDIARIEIENEHSAGAVTLLDERWKRRRVGIVSGNSADLAEPLLAPNYYLDRALGPFADVREAKPGDADPIQTLLDEQVSVMVLADVGVVAGAAHDRLDQFVKNGGVLLRFAGTRLAGSSDDLVPVNLRRGGRVLGGALSWDTPKKLAPFERGSPFFGLTAPDEVTVTRQVLAEPDADLPGKTWAQLADGTPLVTAEQHGKGLIILFHVTADTTWSNLPLSGLFVDMLRRVVAMAGQTASAPGTGAGAANAVDAANTQQTIAPTRVLDGFGVLGDPPVTAKPIPINYDGPADADHPPGFYGPVDSFVAVNTLGPTDQLDTANFDGLKLVMQKLRPAAPVDLRPFIIVIAFLLLLADAVASVWLSGGIRRSRPWGRGTAGAGRAAAVVALFGLLVAGIALAPAPARAADSPAPSTGVTAVSPRDLDAALNTHLAYVMTGDPQVDETSRAGLLALSNALAARTSLSPGTPNGVDPEHDELVFYPFLYWPIVADRPQPSAAAVAKIANFMKEGGLIVFDTRDALTSRPDGPPTPEAQWLRILLAGVDVPELEPVPRDHVVTKTFYLLDNFVGRTTIGQTWIEALPPDDSNDPVTRPARGGDDVSPIIITSNDLAAAWALDDSGQPMFPLIPGGARQRELALRGGINLVMYTLTGNYKADQVHVRDLLEGLGIEAERGGRNAGAVIASDREAIQPMIRR